jgi:hypothetical protein
MPCIPANCTPSGIRIKTIQGATGSVKGITYTGITIKDITGYGIMIEQDYLNGKPSGSYAPPPSPPFHCTNTTHLTLSRPTAGVPITGLTLNDVHGNVMPSATRVAIVCAAGACSDWTWTGVNITGGKTSVKCSNVPGGASC